MDFYIDIGIAVLLRLLRDRRGIDRYYPALAKLEFSLTQFKLSDEKYAEFYARKYGDGPAAS